MIITSATLDALRTEVSLIYKTAYEATPVWYTELATEVPSSGRSNTYGWLAQQLRLRKWVGARVAQNLSEHSYTLTNVPFEGTVEIDKYDVLTDNLGIYKAQMMPELAQAAKKHPDQLLTYGIFYKNPKGFDGKTLFASDHPTYAKNAADPQSYTNDYALELTPDNFNTVWAAQATLRGEDGQPLLALPNRLICAPQLRRRAEEICKASTVAATIQNVAKTQNVGGAGVDNVMKGWAEPLLLPELSLMPNTWYLACTTRPLKPFLRQLHTPYQFVARFNPEDPKVFDEKKFTVGVDGFGTVGTTLPFLIARSMPSGDSLPTIPDDFVL
jgi:phage major head subunit gpT-like protein